MSAKHLKLEADETVLLHLRRHWFILAAEVFLLTVIALLPLILWIVMSVFLSGNADLLSYTGFFIAFYAVWLLIMWMALFNIWTNYYLDVWTLTSKRFIVADQRGFFYRNISSFRLERLQDVSVSVNGLIATFLNFGTVEIQTASEDGTFRMIQIADPESVKARILAAAGDARGAQGTAGPV